MTQTILHKKETVVSGVLKSISSVGGSSAGPDHVVFEGTSKQFSGAGGVLALRDVSFSIRRGEIFGIIGRSGAGKSTLIRMINVLERPTSGRVLVDGVDVGRLDEDRLLGLRRRMGMIFQHFNLLSAKTVRDNVALPLRAVGLPARQVRERVDFLLDMVGLTDKDDVYPVKLSGGQKQRVGIARALVHNPEILLCDEATSALDPETTHSILALLKGINERFGLTIVLITHDMSVIRAICDRVLVLDRGDVVQQGEVWEVFGRPSAEATEALLAPLRHDLPADLAKALLKDPPPDGSGRAIVLLKFAGSNAADEISLERIFRWAPDTRLLHGGLDRIQGHGLGQLLLSVPVSLARAGHLAPGILSGFVKVLGYAPDDV